MRKKLLSVAFFAVMVGCGPIESPGTATYDTNKKGGGYLPEPDSSLKTAVWEVYGSDCGSSRKSPVFQRCEAMIKAASEDDLLVAYTELVTDQSINSWTVGGIARAATSAPFSAKFRDAMRSRRGQLTERRDDVFGYFAKYGDGSDLKWMVETIDGLKGYELKEAEKSIGVLRERLAKEGQ